MNCPPFKRLRGLNQEAVTTVAFEDPFGDDGDFTQDDLDEIDIIASQAITESGTGKGSEPAGTKATEQHRPLFTGLNQTASRGKSLGINHSSSSSRGNAGMSSREPLCNGQQIWSDTRDSYSVLEAQHAELKRKLKEVEDEILLKSGEIRVLRDSLKAAQQDKEAQRQNQILLDTQRKTEQSEREKELNKKVQSLQSELQFKEAEINDIKTKLHSSDKNKTSSPLPKNSPKAVCSVTQRHHGNSSSSSSPLANGFITKEMFEAQVSSRTIPVKSRKEDYGSSSSRTRDLKDPFQSVRPAPKQPRGGVLLSLLLQQPLSGSSLGLTHLLSMNFNVLQQMSSQLGGRPKPGSDAVPAALSPVQSLAVTGINMLSVSQSGFTARNNSSTRSCPGAVLLLPLMDFHLTRLCQAVDAMKSNSTSSRSGGSSSSSASSSCSAALGRLEEEETGLSGFSMEDTGLAALSLLDLLLTHSDEVVEAVLLNTSEREDANSKTIHAETSVGLCNQNSVLKSLLRLSESRLGGNDNSQSNNISSHAMKTLRLLADRTPPTHADRLEGVLQVVLACVSSDSRLQVVSDCVSLLVSLSNHQTLSNQLCSEQEPCVFLKFLQFIRTRADKQAAHTDWILLDLQVVRLLSRLTTQRPERRSCQCYTELVQTVLIVFHRQWLELRGSPELTESTECDSTMSSSPWWSRPPASLLRETLLLLHWLLLHHGSFSESCRPLLHMYDQVIPAVRDTLRKIPELSESEELALEEICRSESDEAEDMETETGS
ncbi:ATR-interacting protein [Gouania willdenowi]|uniref:ATR-interacting protein n=1 Tax=Gouania willdenowi TaxID=441366 RepID=A0A8C5D046_GOUWI|nr:ATR-interacting protein [Gouania willdenowi]